jgi:hypothetical protein
MQSTLASELPTRRTSLPALIRGTTGRNMQTEAMRFLLDLYMTALECNPKALQVADSGQI